MYRIEFTPTALKQIKVFTRANPRLIKSLEKALDQLRRNPNHVGLKTHKVSTRKYGDHFSTRVTGDIRLFWNYNEGKIIVILAVEDHGGYK